MLLGKYLPYGEANNIKQGTIMKRVTVALSILWAFNSFANEQTLEMESLASRMIGTTHAGSQRASTDGELKACGLDFVVFGRDFSTKQGAFYKAVGSYYFRNVNGNPQFWLKLGVFDINLRNPNESKPSKLGNAYVSTNDQGMLKSKARIDSDTPGFYIYIFDATEDSVKVWSRFIQDGKLVIGFNRQAGQQDVLFNMDGSVTEARFIGDEFVRKRSQDNVTEVANCTSLLLKSFDK